MEHTTSRPCAPRARCGDFRNCDICARIRQARIADAATRLSSRHPNLRWTCLSPTDPGPAALAAARAAFLRSTDPPGAIWTVEQSPQTGALHCNIIAPAAPPRSIRIARVWQADIEGDVRRVAAYISKREQMPPRDLYPGRLYGTAGPLWQWLAGNDAPAVVAAAKTQYDIDPAPLRIDTGISRRLAAIDAQHSPADYREIAARRLPELLRAVPLYGRSRASSQVEKQKAPPRHVYYRPVLNSKRVRWLTGTLAAWERDWKPKS